MEKIELTKQGIEDLKAELDDLVNVKREQVLEQIKEAKALGDLSENAEYDAARERQGEIESRIKEIQTILQNAKVISDKPRNTKAVCLGACVTILDLSDNSEETYKIVNTVEAKPFEGSISDESPLGKALINKSVNDVVRVKATPEYEVKVLKIEFAK